MTDIDALIVEARAWKSIPDPNDVIRLCDALQAERARVVELEAENAKLREADWFWDIDSPEYGSSDEEDLADMSGETAVVMELGCALTLPSFWMAATYHDRTGWNATRHETRDDAIRAVDARAALTAHTEARKEPNDKG